MHKIPKTYRQVFRYAVIQTSLETLSTNFSLCSSFVSRSAKQERNEKVLFIPNNIDKKTTMPPISNKFDWWYCCFLYYLFHKFNFSLLVVLLSTYRQTHNS